MSEKDASSARNVAEVAEEAARMAIERAQTVESRLDQFSTAHHVESELAQRREEADRSLQLTQETEQTTRPGQVG